MQNIGSKILQKDELVKLIQEENFGQEKVKLNNYQNLPLVLALINKFECDLYENAVIPIALANQYAAISLVPGGKVLDIFTQNLLKTKT